MQTEQRPKKRKANALDDLQPLDDNEIVGTIKGILEVEAQFKKEKDKLKGHAEFLKKAKRRLLLRLIHVPGNCISGIEFKGKTYNAELTVKNQKHKWDPNKEEFPQLLDAWHRLGVSPELGRQLFDVEHGVVDEKPDLRISHGPIKQVILANQLPQPQ